MVTLEQVDVIINEHVILNQIDINWPKGEAIALCGANGAGKSTLLKVLAGLNKPSSGRLELPGGISLTEWRHSIGVVLPESFLYDALTAKENLHFYRRLYAVKDVRIVPKLLDDMGLSSVQDELVGTFSKGMKQRLSIARSLLHHPSYLLLDEPFEGLDLESHSFLERLLNDLKEKKTGILMINHDIETAWNICHRAILIHQGEVVTEELCDDHTFQPFLHRYRSLLKENNRAIF